MYNFTVQSAVAQLTPWGEEVKRRLRDRQMTQDSLCAAMHTQGYKIDKVQFCILLRGRGVKRNLPLIFAINEYLGIPQAHCTPEGGENKDGKSYEGAE